MPAEFASRRRPASKTRQPLKRFGFWLEEIYNSNARQLLDKQAKKNREILEKAGRTLNSLRLQAHFGGNIACMIPRMLGWTFLSLLFLSSEQAEDASKIHCNAS